VRIERALDAAPVDCDSDQLRQVLWNLLANAADAVRQKGAGGIIRVESGLRGPGAWIAVEDDGPGIAQDDLARVFLPFFTTKQTGTGLGLATVHRIVDAHAGRITVSSERGAGARFEVHLPVPAAHASTAA
jgi:two-component system sensor histidine kinase PilS (NtrC family)